MRYMRRHMKLVKARYVKAHHYFAAKNRAAATHKLLGRWNKAFASAARKHAAAIRHHKYTWKMMRKATSPREEPCTTTTSLSRDSLLPRNMKPLSSEATTTGTPNGLALEEVSRKPSTG